MSWPDAVDGAPPDDHTREHRALYEQVRREREVPALPDPGVDVTGTGPTASWTEHQRAPGVRDAAVARLEVLIAELSEPRDQAA